MSSKSVSQILKILFQIGDINIFNLRGAFSSRYVELKSSFSNEEEINGEICEIGGNRGKVKENTINDRSWSSAKLVKM